MVIWMWLPTVRWDSEDVTDMVFCVGKWVCCGIPPAVVYCKREGGEDSSLRSV